MRHGKGSTSRAVQASTEDCATASLRGEAMLVRSRAFCARTWCVDSETSVVPRDIKEKGGPNCTASASFAREHLVNYVGIDEGIVDMCVEIAGSPRKTAVLRWNTDSSGEEGSRLFVDSPLRGHLLLIC